MYQVGERIIYGSVGVCEVAAVGPLDMQGAKKDREYYTLSPLYQNGKIFAPVDTTVFHRPVLTREQALAYQAHFWGNQCCMDAAEVLATVRRCQREGV